MADQQITIDIETRVENARTKIMAMSQLFRSQTAAMSKSMQGVQQQIQALGRGQGIKMPGIVTMSDAVGEFDSRARKAQQTMQGMTTQTMVAGDAMAHAGRQGKKSGHSMMEAFDGAAMGLMFFGMQVQRIFGGIMRTSISTFQNVMGQLEDTTTATDRLSGAWEFLKFNIGEALQPVMDFLFPIVETVARFVSENQKLVRSFIVTGAVLGTLAMTYGAVKLGMLSVIAMGKRVATSMGNIMGATNRLIAHLGSLSITAGATGTALAAGIFAGVTAAIAGLAALGYKIATNEKIQDSFVDNVGGDFSDAFTDLADSLSINIGHIDSWNTFVDLAVDYLSIFGAALTDVARILSTLVLQAIVSVIEIVKMFGKGLYNLGRVVWELLEGAWKSLLDGFDVFVQKGKAALNIMESIVTVMQNPFAAGEEIDEAASALDTLTDVNMDEFTNNFSGAFDESNFFGGESFMNNVREIAESGQNMIDSFNMEFTMDTIDEIKRQNRLEQANQRAAEARARMDSAKPDSKSTEDTSDTKEETQKEMVKELKKGNLLTEQQNQLLQGSNISKEQLFGEEALDFANQTR